MWFFRSFSYLPRPTIPLIAPELAVFTVYWLLHGLPLAAFGIQLSALGLAICAGLFLTVARNLPTVRAVVIEQDGGWSAMLPVFLVLGLAVLAAGAAKDHVIQLVWAGGWIVHAIVLASIAMHSSAEELAELPQRWASDKRFSRQAMWLKAVRVSIEAVGASAMIWIGSVLDWVVFVSFGRLALYYLFDWIIILTIMTMPDEDV